MGSTTCVYSKTQVYHVLWYLVNNSTFRELSDKFNISKSWAHETIEKRLNLACTIATDHIRWPGDCEKAANATAFHKTRRCDIIGAIDGCHIRLQKPPARGMDYINIKYYCSILFQGIVNHTGSFIDIFVGVPGRVHECRMLRMSPYFHQWQQLMGTFKLLGVTVLMIFRLLLLPKSILMLRKQLEIYNCVKVEL